MVPLDFRKALTDFAVSYTHLQLIEIFHIIDPVIIIAGVRYQSQNLTGFDTGYHTAGGTGIQRQLGGCNLNVSYLINHELVSIIFSAGTQQIYFTLVIGQHILIVECQTQLPPGNHVIIDQVPVDFFRKFRIFLQIAEAELHQLGKYVIRIGIPAEMCIRDRLGKAGARQPCCASA